MVAPPSETHDVHPGITWEAFHKVGTSALTQNLRHILSPSIHCLAPDQPIIHACPRVSELTGRSTRAYVASV